MKKIGINTKQAESFASSWLYAHEHDKTDLYDYYANPSRTKESAMEDLKVKFFTLPTSVL